ncbi:omptin family outer membrane protease [Herbaspirillum autotrophicum]|uniref:omptin family outer membrane protease n=1 Tax=Herbaspirillum autotrophicum TaxID=180195 RepID=UPI000AC7DBEE|nr:omptin family outer membrane protease [Herbaspirillum autotrophicum]
MKRAAVACMLAGLSFGAAAESTLMLKQDKAGDLAVEVGVGRMQAESREYVYDAASGNKVSQLDWKASNVPVLKAALSWSVNPWLTVDARGWTAISSGANSMHDYDWLIAGQSDWSHISYSPDTRLHSAHEIDLSATAWLLRRPGYKIGMVAGYQQTYFNWTAYGGSYSFWNGTARGDFPAGQPIISYRQLFRAPYVGVRGHYYHQQWEFNALVKFSPWVGIDDYDTHHLRNTDFTERSGNSRYYGINLDAGYHVTPDVKLFAAVSWNKYLQGRGPTTQRDMNTGTVYFHEGDAAGMDNKNYAVTVGVKYRF